MSYYAFFINIVYSLIYQSLTMKKILFLLLAMLLISIVTHASFPVTDENSILIENSRVYKYGIIAFFNEIGAGIIGKTSDSFIISALGGQMYMGIFAFSNKIKNIFNKLLPISEFKTVLRPLFFQKFSKSINKEEFINLYNFIVKVMIPIFSIPAIYFIFFGESIIVNIYDPKYLSAYPLGCILLLGNIQIAVFYPVVFTVRLYEKNQYQLYTKVIGIFSIFLGILAMKYYGLIGVILVTTISDMIKKIIIYLLIKKEANITYRISEYKNYIFIFSILVCFSMIISKFISGIISLLLLTFLFGILSILLIILFHPFNKYDIIYIRKLAQSSKLTRLIETILIRISNYKFY